MPVEKYKCHKSLDTLPIYNYVELIKTNDLRYLIKDVDVFNLPRIKNKNKLENIYKILLSSIEYKENILQKTYFSCQNYFMEYLISHNIKLLQKYNNSFNQYLELLDNNYFNYVYKDVKYYTSTDLIKVLKKDYNDETQYLDFLRDRLLLLYYVNINADLKNKYDLYSELAEMQLNGVIIDEFKCSVTKYNKIKEGLIKRLQLRNNGKV